MEVKSQANKIINDINSLALQVKNKKEELLSLMEKSNDNHIKKIEALNSGDFVKVCLHIPYTQEEIEKDLCDPNIDNSYVIFEEFYGGFVNVLYDGDSYSILPENIEIIDNVLNEELIALNNSLLKMSEQMLAYKIINGR